MLQSTPYGLGLDISDRSMMACLRSPDGSAAEETTLSTSPAVVAMYLRRLKDLQPVVALETGTHSNWIYDLAKELGFEQVILADARMLKVIFHSDKKTDRLDAQVLARFAQTCPELLHGIRPRGEQARQDRRLLSARRVSVQVRTKLINHVRGIVKSSGARLADCDTQSFPGLAESLPENLRQVLAPLFAALTQLTESIADYDKLVKQRCTGDPVIERLMQVPGVGPTTALAFESAIEDPARFARNRTVASYLGLRPKVDQSGTIEKQLRITKAGDGYVRQLLVQCAHAILSKRTPVSDLKRWGQNIAESGGKRGKRRAAVAVARKLAVLLLTLWKTGSDYEPLRKRTAANGPEEVKGKGAAAPASRRASRKPVSRKPAAVKTA